MMLALAASVSVASAAGQSFWGCGLSAFSSTRPHPSGWCAGALLANQKAQLWNVSELDFLPVRPTSGGSLIQTSVEEGLATPLKQYGSVQIFGLAAAGMATTGANSGAAFSGGGVAIIPLNKHGWILIPAIRVLKSAVGTTQALIQLGFGRYSPK